MTFRVITGNTCQGGAKPDGDNQKMDLAPPRRQAAPPAPNGLGSLVQGGDLAPVAQLMDRLESLSFTFEALNAGSRSYAAEAVLETLARMERRDLQALAAIEAFASALKTVSQHLAGLRNAVHATAHETAAAMEHIGDRLTLRDGRNGTGDGNEAAALAAIAERLTGIEAKVAEPIVFDGFDESRLAETLDAIAHRVSRIEKKIAEMPTDQAGGAAATTTVLETIARRLSRLEQKVEQPTTPAAVPAVDVARINAALETIARRVARIEKRVEEPAAQPRIEVDTGPINDALATMAQRVAEMERRADGGPDGSSIAACLLIVAERLSRIEAAFAAAPAEMTASPAAAPAETVTPAPAAGELAAAPQLEANTPAEKRNADEAVGARQRVDLLLEQVFRVLSH